MRVAQKQSDDWSIESPKGKLASKINEVRSILDALIMRLQRTSNPILHSPAFLSTLKATQINASNADVVHLHWVCGGYLSIEEIARITKPAVWTLHDMWAFCGTEHYAPEDSNTRWRQGYSKANRNSLHSGLDIDQWVWRRKLTAWTRPFHIVAPSRWLAACVRDSALMHGWPVTVIPNALDTQVYKPWPKQVARHILGLPSDKELILFGAQAGCKDPRKGWDLLQPALSQLAGRNSNIQGVIFGQSEPQAPPQLGLHLHWTGHLHDDSTLSLLYSAADVMVVPSRQENLPQSGTEAQACGCPVVAFDVTGLPDVVEHGSTGYLTEPYSSDELAKGIEWILIDQERYARLCAQARERAVRLWSPSVIVPQYIEVYKEAIETHKQQFGRII